MLWARAASMSFLTLGTAATQRGRTPQLAFMKSRTSSAVVLGSTVTGLSSGTGGGFTLAHSVMMSPAQAGIAPNAAATASAVAQPNCLTKLVMDLSPLARNWRGITSHCALPPTLARGRLGLRAVPLLT